MADFVVLEEDGTSHLELEESGDDFLLEESAAGPGPTPGGSAGGVHVGSMGSIGGTGTVTVTDIPFQPVAVLFLNQVSFLGPPGQMLGCATADDEQWVIWGGMDVETSGYFVRHNEARTDACIFNRAAPYSTIAYLAEFVAFTADGFTVDVTTHNYTGPDVYYMALGGQNIQGAYAGTVTTGDTTGTTAVTAPGFEPQALIMAHTLEPAFDTGRQVHCKWGVGVADASLNQFSSYAQIRQSPGEWFAYQTATDSVACAFDNTNGMKVALDSMDTNGFTLDVTDAYPSDVEFGYLAIDATVATAGSDIQPDATGVQTFPIDAFEPAGVFFCWPGTETSDTDGHTGVAEQRPGIGFMSATEQANAHMHMYTDFPFGVVHTDGYTGTSAIEMRGLTGTSGIFGGDADPESRAGYDSFAMGEFSVDWSVASSGADRPFGWLALPGDLPFTWTPSIYRRVMGT